jgi:REP element-mobilizing transposase RayT
VRVYPRRLKPAATVNDKMNDGNHNNSVAAPFRVRMKEKKHRLPRENYIGEIVASFTICIEDRKHIFTAKPIFKSVERILLESLKKFNCVSYIHLFMPEHCHLLIGGNSINSNLWRCMVDFKQQSGYWFQKNNCKVRWQKDFYDHILRKNEEVEKQVKYILNNPFRKNIVDSWKEYDFKGSTIYDFSKWQ